MCENCGRAYPVRDRVLPIMIIDEAEPPASDAAARSNFVMLAILYLQLRWHTGAERLILKLADYTPCAPDGRAGMLFSSVI